MAIFKGKPRSFIFKASISTLALFVSLSLNERHSFFGIPSAVAVEVEINDSSAIAPNLASLHAAIQKRFAGETATLRFNGDTEESGRNARDFFCNQPESKYPAGWGSFSAGNQEYSFKTFIACRTLQTAMLHKLQTEVEVGHILYPNGDQRYEVLKMKPAN